ncbi:MAG: DUF3313 domain-containing protein [Gammaproteobacteria bacterium]
MIRQTSLMITVCICLLASTGANADAHHSGFLDDYSQLTADSGRAGAMVYRKEGVSLNKYNKIAMTPIEIWLSPNSKYKGASPDDLKAIADALTTQIVNTLGPSYPVVSAAGEGVLQMRIAISNITMKKKKRGLLSFTPAGFALTTLKDIAGKRIIMDSAVIEAELTDSQTGEVVALLVDDLAKTTGKEAAKESWQKLEKAFGFYAERFKARLDAER